MSSDKPFGVYPLLGYLILDLLLDLTHYLILDLLLDLTHYLLLDLV